MRTKLCLFLTADRWIEFFYFNLPLLLIFVVNASLFIKTALVIRNVQLEMVKMTSKEESGRHQTHFDKEKDRYVPMGIHLYIVKNI